MFRTRSPWLLALILGSTLVAAAAASAADSTNPATPPSGHTSRFQQALGLTDDQMSAIRQMHAQQAANRKQLRQSLRQAQSDLRWAQAGLGAAVATGTSRRAPRRSRVPPGAHSRLLTPILPLATEGRGQRAPGISSAPSPPPPRRCRADSGHTSSWHSRPPEQPDDDGAGSAWQPIGEENDVTRFERRLCRRNLRTARLGAR